MIRGKRIVNGVHIASKNYVKTIATAALWILVLASEAEHVYNLKFEARVKLAKF